MMLRLVQLFRFELICFFLVLVASVRLFAVASEPPANVPSKSDTIKSTTVDETAPFIFDAARPDDAFLDLNGEVPTEMTQKRLPVRVTKAGGRTWLLPVYVIKDVQLPGTTGTESVVRVVLFDALYHPKLEAAIKQAMNTEYGKDVWSKAVPNDNRVRATLTIEDGDRHTPIGTATFVRKVGRKEVTLSFPLDSISKSQLIRATPANLGLTFEEVYRGRFTDTDVEATATVSNTVATSFQNKLGVDPKGQKAMLLVAIGGSVDQNVSIRQVFSRQVTIELWQGEGKSANQTMLDKVVEKLFAGVAEEKAIGDKSTDAVVTFLTSNGLKATASIGTFKGLKDQLRIERDRSLKTANSGSTEDHSKLSAEAKAFSTEVKFESEEEQKRGWANSFEQQIRSMDEVMKAIEGELPVAVLSAKQVQDLASRADTATAIKLGTFREGRKSMRHEQSMAEAFETVVKDRPKTEVERSREAVKKLVGQLEQAKKALSERTTTRDTIFAENKPHEESLVSLKKKVAETQTAVAAAQEAFNKAKAKFNEGWSSLIELSNKLPAPRLDNAENRTKLERDCNLPELRATLKEREEAFSKLAVEMTSYEKNIMLMRTKFEKAAKEVAEAETQVANLEVELKALNRLVEGGKW